MMTAAVGIAITAAIVTATNTATATTARPTLTSSRAIGAQLYPELCRENRCAPFRHNVKSRRATVSRFALISRAIDPSTISAESISPQGSDLCHPPSRGILNSGEKASANLFAHSGGDSRLRDRLHIGLGPGSGPDQEAAYRSRRPCRPHSAAVEPFPN